MVYNINRKIGSGSFTEVGTRTDATNGLISERLVGITTQQYDNDENSTMNNIFIQFIDTPNTTEEVEYSIGIRSEHTTTFNLNSVKNTGSDDASFERASSNLILIELAGIGT